ncbi:MAG: methionine adenosyltransferase [Endomicrobiia bacterium]
MNYPKNMFFTSESVAEGHPDKVCDQISDAVLDECLKQDLNSRVACETFVSMGLVIVGGEITTKGYVDIHKLVRDIVKEIGYTSPAYGFDYKTISILNAIHSQSPDIAQGVNLGKEIGAGDQGSMFGYATIQTKEYMPLPIILAHRLVMKLAEVRKKKILPFLGPDGKSQVTVEYRDGKPVRVDYVVIAAQHTEEVLTKDKKYMREDAKEEIIKKVIIPVLGEFYDKKTKITINGTGKFVIGGPQSDTGMTGRKIIVDTYGGWVVHGGGAFSGKDPTKVDRSASYMARYIAKNIVAAGLAEECLIQLSYCIGLTEPVSLMVNTFGTGKISDDKLEKLIRKIFPLSPKGIIEHLKLLRPIYKKTSVYGHFGREDKDFTWEKTDMAEELQKYAKKI